MHSFYTCIYTHALIFVVITVFKYIVLNLLFQSGLWVPGVPPAGPGGAPPPSSGYGMPPPPGGAPGYPTQPTSGQLC